MASNQISKDSDTLDVVVETPKGSRCKFSFDEKECSFRLKSILPTGASFPYDFGFIPNTRADDGDPLDVLCWWTLRPSPDVLSKLG